MSKSLSYFVCLCVLSLITLAGCECGESQVSGFPRLEVDPDNVVFSAVSFGETDTKTVIVRSAGQLEVRISSIKVVVEQGGEAYALPDQAKWSFPLTLEPGETLALKVRYKPVQTGAASGFIHIASDASNTDSDGLTKVRLLSSSVDGRLLLSPDPLDFGVVAKDKSKTLPLTLRNQGNAEIKITKADLDDANGQFALSDKVSFPLAVAPGKSATLDVTFTPTQATAKGQLTLSHDGGKATAQLVGRMAAAQLEVTPLRLVYSGVPIGQSKSESLTIKNIGALPAVIESIPFEKDSEPHFTWAKAPTLPLTIEPNKEVKLEVVYKASSDRPLTRSLVINSNDPTKPSIRVTLDANPKGCLLKPSPQLLSFSSDGTKPIQLANVGNAACDLKKLSLDTAGSKAFSIANGPKAGDSVLPNSSVTVEIKYEGGATKAEESLLIVESNDVAAPSRSIPLKAGPATGPECQLTVSPTVVQYGYVALGGSKKATINITNKGIGDCTLNQVILNSALPAFAIQSTIPSGGKTIGAGQVFKLEVTYTPVNEQNAEGTLELKTSDPVTPQFTVRLLGYSGERCLVLQPDPLDLGLVKTGCTSIKRRVTMLNTCDQSLKIDKIVWQQGTTSEFSWGSGLTFPLTLAAGKSLWINVEYKPTDLGPDSGVLEFHNSVTGQSPMALVVQGEGVATNERVETFNQKQKAQIDVLFVIDDSNSMRDEQQSIATNLNSFMQWASRLQADFHIAVTTTDADCGTKYSPKNGMCDRGTRPTIPLSGCFRGSPTVLTPQTPSLLQVFSRNVQVGLQGSGNEQGIEASYQAFQPDRLKSCNKGFYRADAALSIIYVSDEVDSSPNAVSFYVQFFLGLKGGRADLVRASAVVGPPGDCINSSGKKAKHGPDYLDISTQLRGVQASICSTNWSNTLSQLGTLTFGLQRQFFLKSAADPSTIQVKVNGKVVSQGSSGWSYGSSDSSLIFAAGAAPEPGATIEVRYTAKCNP